jgi:hypothetical protein
LNSESSTSTSYGLVYVQSSANDSINNCFFRRNTTSYQFTPE